MNPTTLPNKPPMAGDYDLGDGRYCRVTLTRVGSHPGHVTFEAQAWQLDSGGLFVTDAAGWPVRTPGTRHSISLSGIVARTTSLEAGWVRYLPPPNKPLDPDALPEGWVAAKTLPATGTLGDHVIIGDKGWQWGLGDLELIRQGKADDLAQILAVREMEALIGIPLPASAPSPDRQLPSNPR